jgi:excisionase family DNA binding protein
MSHPRLLRLDEAAERLRVSHATLYRLLARGEVHAVRIGSGTRIAEEDPAAFVEQLRRDSHAEGESREGEWVSDA